MKPMSMLKRFFGKTRIYLDYAAATPVRKEVAVAMAPFMRGDFGNASAIHAEGRFARKAIEQSRKLVAELLRVRKEEVFFVSGGTEANNLALVGVIEALASSGRSYSDCEVITTAIEHPSILGVLARLKEKGVVVHTIPVNTTGLVDLSQFKRMLSPKTVLVSIAYANSEIGVVQDIKKISHGVRQYQRDSPQANISIHVDASQAPLYLPCALNSLGVDLMTLDAGKMYGPKGVGVLIKKHAVALQPLFIGGDQEGGVRPGTENTALIVGCAEALCIALKEQEARVQKVRALRDYAFDEINQYISGVLVNGSLDERIANNINISIPGIDGEFAAVTLDTHGIAVSTKSACSGLTGSGSAVIYAMGGDDARALSTIRMTLGEETTKGEIDHMVRVLKTHVEKTRQALDQLHK